LPRMPLPAGKHKTEELKSLSVCDDALVSHIRLNTLSYNAVSVYANNDCAVFARV
jgi:hypothetical protein